ncbi:Na+/H+ antiporter NhaC family protein [Gallaecimonas sp. GXIMD4217]|uniref:Na+/H+ antiporter NhaC family protein n=1 Tax=Gallaecimonas sp. GXIMD4217 TaxID=3131927 RepID=UPI00311ADB8F
MELNDFSTSWISLLVPLVALGLVLVTKRVLPTLLLGAGLGAVLLAGTHAPAYLGNQGLALLWDGGPNWWTLQIVAFLLMLGALSRLLARGGATESFANACAGRIHSRRGAGLMTVGLGFAIFIDDYFNSLAVGQATRPVADRHGLSRAKLAYLIDSTAAPVCALVPLSSWGAFILSLLAPLAAAPMGLFLDMSLAAFYPWLALALVLVAAGFDWNLGAMKAAQARAGKTERDEQAQGAWLPLLGPLGLLLACTMAALFVTGALASQGPFDAIKALENTDVGLSLVLGALPSLLWAGVACPGSRLKAMVEGARQMLPAVWLLLAAWLLAAVMKDVKAGDFLAGHIQALNVGHWLPLALFGVAALMALATGSSWGTFGIMIPLAAQLVEPALLPLALGALISGAVFGDHCSPASDTTILASAGAQCDHLQHVLTQLPYAGLAAGVSALGYVAATLGQSLALGWLVAGAGLAVALLWLGALPWRAQGRSISAS